MEGGPAWNGHDVDVKCVSNDRLFVSRDCLITTSIWAFCLEFYFPLLMHYGGPLGWAGWVRLILLVTVS